MRIKFALVDERLIGLMILDKKVLIKIVPSNINWFKNKGYKIVSLYEVIEVDIKDLQPTSNAKINCKCDICGKEFVRKFNKLDFNKMQSCGEQKCKQLLRENTCFLHYGVKVPRQSKELNDKITNTFIDRYGLNSDGYEKFQNKRILTNIKNCGNKRGYIGNDAQKKALKTLASNWQNANCKIGSKKPASKQQIKICELLNGILNYKIGRYYADIVLEEEKIVVEFDGQGHFYFRKDNDIDEKRDKEFIDYGWKIVHLFSHKKKINYDKIASFIEICKEHLLTCNVVFFDLDNEIFKKNLQIK